MFDANPEEREPLWPGQDPWQMEQAREAAAHATDWWQQPQEPDQWEQEIAHQYDDMYRFLDGMSQRAQDSRHAVERGIAEGAAVGALWWWIRQNQRNQQQPGPQNLQPGQPLDQQPVTPVARRPARCWHPLVNFGLVFVVVMLLGGSGDVAGSLLVAAFVTTLLYGAVWATRTFLT